MNTKPLTVEEVAEASDIFFPIYEYVRGRLPTDTSVEDALKVVENICSLAQKLRLEKELEKQPFGFNKKNGPTD